ncbi:hypothetical protein L6R53_04675 [Myxococcota bacterium]|nr:hypothetical protein [Myxococcota bacterium]
MSADEVLARTQWDLFWLPPDVDVVDRPDLLLLRCEREVPALNVVLRARGAPADLPALVAEVQGRLAGRPARWTVGPLEPGAALEAALHAAGWSPGHLHHGFTLPVDRPAPPSRVGVRARAVTDMAGLRDWLWVAERAFGEPRGHDPVELEQFLAACTGAGARVRRVVAYDAETGAPLSAGGLTLFPDLGFGFLWAGGTVPEGRGRGAYSAVLAARMELARRAGATAVGLYAREGTSAPIVARLGFARHGAMTFWERRC